MVLSRFASQCDDVGFIAECRRAIVAKHATLAWALLCSLLGIAYCAAHRTQLREKFGIAGMFTCA